MSQIGAAMPHPSAAASGRLLRIAVASRVAVLVVGYLAVVTSGYQLKSPQYRLSHEELWNLPARWDAGWYLGIARRGYDWRPDLVDRQQSIAFFPAYPLAMRVAGEVVTLPARAVGQPGLLGNGNTRVTWGGVAVSIVAFTLAVVQLHRLITSMTGDAAMASRTVGLLASWPFALFFSAPYAEGLFLLASVSATSEACQKRWGRCSLWGLIAGLTRSNGWALAPMLVAMALADRTARHRLRAAVLATGPVAGTVVFSVYIWSLTGQPLAWLHAQAGWGRSFEPAAFVTRRASQLLEQGLWNYLAADPVDAIAVACVVGSLAGALAAGRRFGWRFALFPLAYLLPALLIDLPAIGRMTSVLFVSFVGLASALGNRQTLVVAGMSALLQCWLAARFFTWQTPH